MKEFPIPVRATEGAIGPVSQPDDDSFSYMPFPLEAPAFSMPQVPEDADAASVAAARRLLARFVEQMDDGATPRVELSALPAGVLRVLNESLGEGEDFSYMAFPRDVPTFSMPQLPEDADAASLGAARRLLERFSRSLAPQRRPDVQGAAGRWSRRRMS